MRALLSMLAVTIVVAAPARAQQAEIEGVIGAQIDAFEADDFASAFQLASPMIQGMFQTPENFGMMVKQGYPMVYRPGEVLFLELEDLGGSQRQTVAIRDGSGSFHVLEYDMVDGPDGWKINGVRLVPAPGIGV